MIVPPTTSAAQPEVGTFRSVNSTAAIVQNTNEMNAKRVGWPSATRRSSCVGGRPASSQRRTGSFARTPPKSAQSQRDHEVDRPDRAVHRDLVLRARRGERQEKGQQQEDVQAAHPVRHHGRSAEAADVGPPEHDAGRVVQPGHHRGLFPDRPRRRRSKCEMGHRRYLDVLRTPGVVGRLAVYTAVWGRLPFAILRPVDRVPDAPGGLRLRGHRHHARGRVRGHRR